MTAIEVEVDTYDPGPARPVFLDLLEEVERGRPKWHRDALCREFPAVSWFPAKGGSSDLAKGVCSRCLALEECQAWALDQGPELAGIFGGLSARDRAQRRLDVLPPGRAWPLAPLEAACGMSRRGMARRLGVATSTTQVASRKGVTRETAERWAAQLGLRPERVWPGWDEPVEAWLW